MDLEHLLEETSYKMPLKYKDYNAYGNNCQDFIKYVVYFLCAKRHLHYNEIHMISKLHIHLILLKQIENNEKKWQYPERFNNIGTKAKTKFKYLYETEYKTKNNYYYNKKPKYQYEHAEQRIAPPQYQMAMDYL